MNTTTKQPVKNNEFILYLRFYTAFFFGFLLNPFLWVECLKQAYGQLFAVFQKPAKQNDLLSIQSPVQGTWRIHRGGYNKETSHSWSMLSQRYAFDLIKIDEKGNHSEKKYDLESYYTFGAHVLSPLPGKVVTVVDGLSEHTSPETGWFAWYTRDMCGNHIVIEHGDGIYSLLAHLKKDSIVVKPGQEVKEGQFLGQIGNSGHSTEPHLHFQMQRGKHPLFSRSLPFVFANIQPGKQLPETGAIIESSDGSSSHQQPNIQQTGFWEDFIFSLLFCFGVSIGVSSIIRTYVTLLAKLFTAFFG